MRIQLWSCNYDPEPMGIGPIAGAWARAVAARGHRVDVVSAHPHYPKPDWGFRRLPYHEQRDGIRVTRLPLAIGRAGKGQRLAQELSFLAMMTAASPFLGRADVIVSVSPSFPALLPALVTTRVRRKPWVLWLQDILPDGAATTGYLDRDGLAYALSSKLELAAYGPSSRHIVVLSESFRENLIAKGVPGAKISVAYNPATLPVESRYGRHRDDGPPRILCMGNVGRSQGLVEIVREFEGDPALAKSDARLVLAGTGVAEDEVMAAVTTDRVEMPGLLQPEELDREIGSASLAVVAQAYDGGEFNVPSKLMNYLASGLPVVARVRPTSEAARIVEVSRSGWVAPPGGFATTIARALADPGARRRASASGLEFARSNLTVDVLASGFERVLSEAADARSQ